MGQFDVYDQIKLWRYFTQSMCGACFYSNDFDAMSDDIIHAYVEYVAQTFSENDIEDPRYDKYSKFARILQQHFKGYKDMDPAEKQQKRSCAMSCKGLIKKTYRRRKFYRPIHC